jgi:hypothetical protein
MAIHMPGGGEAALLGAVLSWILIGAPLMALLGVLVSRGERRSSAGRGAGGKRVVAPRA